MTHPAPVELLARVLAEAGDALRPELRDELASHLMAAQDSTENAQ